MKPVRFHPWAEVELTDSIEYYEARIPGLGVEFRRAVETAVKLVRENPKPWARRTKNTQAYVMRRFPFSIVYLDLPDHIWIIAIAHASRRPGYWGDRVRRNAG